MTNNQEKLQNKTVSRETPAPGGSREVIALKALGKRVEDARKAKGLSIRAVGNETGISEATISNLEKGKLNNIGFNNLVSICGLVGINQVTF